MLTKHLRLNAVAIAVISTIFTPTLLAEETKESEEIDRISVWSTQVKSSSVYMGNTAIATKQADHISDLLRAIPGVDVGGAHSLNQRITIRSMDDKDLKITIDGANQNTYMYHHMGNLQIHADILKSVDIEVGSNSVINGGLGGSVRFETKEAKELLAQDEKFGARVQVNYADNAAKGYSLTGYGLLTDTIDFLAYYNYVERDNYKVGGEKILDSQGNEIDGTNGEVVGLEGEVNDALIKFGWDINSDQRIELGYESYNDEGDYSYRPDMGLATDIAIGGALGLPLVWPTEFSRDTLTINYDANWGDSSSVKVALFNNESELQRDETGMAESSWYVDAAGYITGTAENTGINVLANSVLGKGIEHELTYGLDIVKYKTNYYADYINVNDARSSEEAINSAIFIEDRIDFGNGFFIIPGVRYDSYDLESKVVDDTFSDFSAALAAEYSFNENFIVKASSTQLFKGPEIGEVFTGAGLGDVENSDIEAETGFNHEIAFAFEDNVLGADSFTAGITFFQTQINDYIYDYAAVPGGGPRDTWKDNVGDMDVDGFEFYTGYAINEFALQFTYASAESELSAFEDYSDFEGARLDRQQGDTLTLSADYAIPSVDLALHWDMQIVDDVEDALALDSSSKMTAKDGYTLHNLSISWQPQQAEGLSVIFGIDNVFDEFYVNQSSRTGSTFHPLFGELYLVDYEPGRNIKTTISYQF